MALESGDEVYIYADPGSLTSVTPASVGGIVAGTMPLTVKGAYFDVSAGQWTTAKVLDSFTEVTLQATIASVSGATFNAELVPEGPAENDDIYLYATLGQAAFNPSSIGIQIQSLPAIVSGSYFNVSAGKWYPKVTFEFYRVVELNAAIPAVSALSGSLAANEGLSTVIAGTSSIQGGLGSTMGMRATITSASAISGTLVRLVELRATIPANSSISPALSIEMGLRATIPSLSSIVGGSPKPLASDGLIFYNSVELAPGGDGERTFLITLPVLVTTSIDLTPED